MRQRLEAISAMRLEKCPRCGNPVVKTDQVCISCGLDLLEAERKLSAQAAAEAAKADKRPQPTPKNPAASGVATDVGQDTRLHVYDHFYAEKLTKEKQSTFVTAIVGACLGILLLCIAAAWVAVLVFKIDWWVDFYRWARTGLARTPVGFVYYELFNTGAALVILGLPAALIGD